MSWLVDALEGLLESCLPYSPQKQYFKASRSLAARFPKDSQVLPASTLLELFKARIQSPRDGTCGFYSISQALGHGDSSQRLKDLAHSVISSERKIYSEFLDDVALLEASVPITGQGIFDDYCKALKGDPFFQADHLVLHAICKALRIALLIFELVPAGLLVTRVQVQNTRKYVCLFRSGNSRGGHYELLIPDYSGTSGA